MRMASETLLLVPWQFLQERLNITSNKLDQTTFRLCFSLFVFTLKIMTTYSAGGDIGFFQRGGCKYESSRQTPQGQRNGGGGSWRVMFEYVDFRHFDFRGINLSNLRHYY